MNEAERLELAVAEAREVIRECHTATKDLKRAVKECKSELREVVEGYFDDLIQPIVEKELKGLGASTRMAYDSVQDGFETLARPTMQALVECSARAELIMKFLESLTVVDKNLRTFDLDGLAKRKEVL